MRWDTGQKSVGLYHRVIIAAMLSEKFHKCVFFMFGLLGIVQSGVSIYLLGRVPSANGLFFGLSLERLVLAGGIAFVGGVFLVLSLGTWLAWGWVTRMRQGWQAQLQTPRGWGSWLVGSVLLLIGGSFFTLITPEITEPFASAYFLRLQPLAVLLAGLAGQTLLALPLMRDSVNWRQKLLESPESLHVAGLYGLFLIIAAGIEHQLTQHQPDPVGWNSLGTPLLDTQVLFTFVLGLVLVGVGILTRKPKSNAKPARFAGWHLDLFIFALLWIVAAGYWSSLPLQSNWYVSPPRYPTFTYFPNADGMVYDTTAQSLLSGLGYKSSHLPYPRRPLYDLFLFGLYLIKGQDYVGVVTLQTMLFAIFPALVYLIGKTLHNRLAGLLAGLLVLLREGNAIALTGVITTSHSKMTMSDFPTALGVVLFAWVAFRWLDARGRDSDPAKRLGLIMVAGGIVAATMQIRVETGVFIPVIFGLGLLQLPQLKTRYLASLLVFVACMGLVIGPWVYRNWTKTGQLYFETPDARINFLLERLRLTSDAEVEVPQAPPGDGNVTPTPRQKSIAATTSDALAQDTPPTFLQILTNHMVHSQSQAILLFPDTYRFFDSTINLLGHKNLETYWVECCSGKAYVKRLPFWQWGKWSGELPFQSFVPLLINLFVLAVGFQRVWKKLRWNGLLPLGLAFGYFFANALARTSGGRYMLPVDWVWIIYYAVGMAAIITSSFRMFGLNSVSLLTVDPAPIENLSNAPPRKVWRVLLPIALGFLLLGISIPAAELVIPPRYTDETLKAWLTALETADQDQQLTPYLDEFFANGGLVWQGRGYYLRYYGANQGESGSLYPAVYPQPYPRLSVFLVGPTNIGVSLPLSDRPKIRAENAADVLIFGCPQNGEKGIYFDALAFFYPSTGEIFTRSLASEIPISEMLACPLPAP